MKLIMLGAPGAGKGTQAKMIAEKYDIPHISTGDLFRYNMSSGTELGKQVKAYIDKGQLVPDDVTVAMLMDRIGQEDCRKGYVLDGFPRTIQQAEALDDALQKEGTAVDMVIDIEVDDQSIVERMSGRRTCPGCGATYHIVHNAPREEGVCDKCGEKLVSRADDAPETVQNRLNVYHEQTQPLISYYNEQGILKEIDGTMKMDAVFGQITAFIDAM